MTNKFAVKSSFINKITPFISTFDTLKEWAKHNCYSLYNSMLDANERLVQLGIKFYSTNYNGNIGISYQRLYIKTDYSQTARFIRFRHHPLIQNLPSNTLNEKKPIRLKIGLNVFSYNAD